ncbi:Mitotic_control protein dis3 [Hexamita inflata]|uniref:Mitotic control protein dis3 n=1 Tax=Hexamita inflata TaxID=28002 RepID=A0AA86NXY5_9EUKA|nr:Mitotic control protein dis3 [Hexamita inflata]
MPLKRPNQNVQYEPTVKKQLITVERNDIACQVQTCAECQALSFYKPLIVQDIPILLCDSETIINHRNILTLVSNLQLVSLSSIQNVVEQKNKQVGRFISQKMVYSYPDQVSIHTKVQPYSEEAAIKSVQQYYQSHMKCTVYSITKNKIDEPNNIQLDQFFTENTHSLLNLAMPVDDFLSMNIKQGDTEMQKYDTIYMPHLNGIQTYLDNNQVLKGTFKAYGRNQRGVVFCSGFVCNIPDIYCVNRAIDGDSVAIRLFSKEKTEQVISESELYPLVSNIYEGLDTEQKQFGVIVGILERKKFQFSGTLKKSFEFKLDEQKLVVNAPTEQFFNATFISTSQVAPNFIIRSSQDLHIYTGHRIVAELVEWTENSLLGVVSFRRDIGEIGQRDVEAETVFFERQIRCFDLENDELLKELPTKIIDESQSRRVDMTDAMVCSVDPPGCKDIDDALHFRGVNDIIYNKLWREHVNKRVHQQVLSQDQKSVITNHLKHNTLKEVGVHIADVTNYVKFDSKIDQEARKRGTSVYLADRRIDMLPKLLTECVCSLVSDGPRFCFSVLFLMDPEGTVLTYQFVKTTIINQANLTYQEAYNLINNPTVDINSKFNQPDLKQGLSFGLNELFRLSQIMRKQRFENGSLTLESAEIDFKLDDNKNPIGVQQHKMIPTMSMVEEFMLLANVYAAKLTYETFKSCAVLRKHPQPSQEIFDDLKEKLKHYGVDMDTSSSISIRSSMEHAGQYKKILQTLVTRCMQLAKYFSSGTLAEQDFFHYGLALPIYTHFTSPIRRYADDMVHRLLAAAIEFETLPHMLNKNEDVEQICRHLNDRKEEADRAGRDADRIFGVLFMLRKQLKGEEMEVEGEVVNIGKKVVFLLRDFGVEVETRATEISPDKMSCVIKNKTLKVFEKAQVKVGFDFDNPWDFKLKVDLL